MVHKPLRQQRQDMLDALDDMLSSPESKPDRILALREVQATAKRMADGMARSLLSEWCVAPGRDA